MYGPLKHPEAAVGVAITILSDILEKLNIKAILLKNLCLAKSIYFFMKTIQKPSVYLLLVH